MMVSRVIGQNGMVKLNKLPFSYNIIIKIDNERRFKMSKNVYNIIQDAKNGGIPGWQLIQQLMDSGDEELANEVSAQMSVEDYYSCCRDYYKTDRDNKYPF